MKYYEINKKTMVKGIRIFKFVVENEKVARDICKRYPDLSYTEIELEENKDE